MTKAFVTLALLASIGCFSALAQPPQFSGFTAGNLVVSRSVYTGTPASIVVGQPLPPVCPSTAACGTGKAVVDGTYPAVFANEGPDASFGITSPIFLDQVTPAGALVNTFAVPPNMIVTSFSSKSELALNLSSDGTAITFMGYIAPLNTLDVSNGNTPTVYDPTNPAGGTYPRGVAQVGANGSLQVTPTSAYNGNNGRAAVLANGLYYMAGNANNGSGTPANVVASAGIQIAKPGQALNTLPQAIGNFSITQVTNPTTGTPYAADKLGKDNNFRGLTIFNNTLYTTKGSGSNGINTVYQVGAAGTLPTLANAATAPVTVLPGFPTVLARDATAVNFPFGIWFANATTLYVADEGDGTTANAATSTTAGLQKWTLISGTWKLAYVMQKGLNLGTQYGIPLYPAALNPATAGLRNIAGRFNADGTVTIFGVTSTVSTNVDTGADPNRLVVINDVLANTDPSVGTAQQFSTLRTAAYGEVLRGVSLTPASLSTTSVNVPEITSVANPGATSFAPGSLVAANGLNLATGFPGPIFGLLPAIFGGASVTIVDASGNSAFAPLYYVSPNEIGFQVPAGLANGIATVKISNNGVIQTTTMQIAAVAPGLFTLNGSGLASAYAIRVSGTSQIVETVYSVTSAGAYAANPISLGSGTDQTFLILYGTGFQAAGTSGVTATINGLAATVAFAGAQGVSPGLDQVNVQIPASLKGKGNVNVQLTASGVAANPVQITIQ
jgi:uncharacterized protein (TIGR03437 family)